MNTCKRDRMILKQRLTEAVRDPAKIFEEGWHRDPAFCLGFFDRCEDLALAIQPEAFSLAQLAVEMACSRPSGGPGAEGCTADGRLSTCLENQAHGVLSHAHIARGERFWAGHILDLYRDRAMACCDRCRSNFLLRQGDLLGEERDASGSLAALNGSLEAGGRELGEDARGRILFPRSIAYHHAGQRRQAIDDVGRALQLFSLDSPRGFFLDSLALLVIFVGGGDMSDDARALQYIQRFESRIQGGRDWAEVHTRRFWAEAQLHARLGDIPIAYRKLTNSQTRLLVDGLDRELVAASLDRAQVKCRPSYRREDNLRIAQDSVEKCMHQRPGLDPAFQEGLREVLQVLKKRPRDAFETIRQVRNSFIAPVPGALGERIGPE